MRVAMIRPYSSRKTRSSVSLARGIERALHNHRTNAKGVGGQGLGFGGWVRVGYGIGVRFYFSVHRSVFRVQSKRSVWGSVIKIGRASCRERVWVAVGDGEWSETE